MLYTFDGASTSIINYSYQSNILIAPMKCVTISDDCKYIVFGSDSGSIALIDQDSGERTEDIPNDHIYW